MSKSKSPQEVGKDFEETFRLLLKDLQKRCPCNFHRFYDTHSAGAYLPEQPADFLLGFDGGMHFIECKSSDTHQTLASGLADLFSKDQAANLRMWSRAGASTHILFLSQRDGRVELWDGLRVSEARAAGKRIKAEGICHTYANFADFAFDFEYALKRNMFFKEGVRP